MEKHMPVAFVRTRLSILMFLQFAIWGTWAPVLANHLFALGFTGTEVGYVYLTGALGCILSPVIGGQIADRWFPTQVFLSISFFLTGAFLYFVAQATTFWPIFLLALGSMVCFGPTLGLSNSLSFHHMTDARKDYPVVRLWGTLGWIAAGIIVSVWMGAAWLTKWFGVSALEKHPPGHALYFGAGFAVLCGAYSLTLPNTPPKKDAGDQFAMGKVLAMLKDPSFAIFSALAFFILFAAAGYYNFQGAFFEKGMHFDVSDVPMVALVGQVMEILTLLILPLSIKKLGTKTTISIGIFMWALRFAIFGIGSSQALVIFGQSLHGFCFAFAIAATMIYVEQIAAADIRGSVQSFLVIVSYGFGLLMGSLATGPLLGYYTTKAPVGTDAAAFVPVINWSYFWFTLSGGCALVLVLFIVGFKARDEKRGSVEDDVPAMP